MLTVAALIILQDGFQTYRPLPRQAFMKPSWPEASSHHTDVQSVGGGLVLADEDTLRIYASSRSGLPHTPAPNQSPGGNRTMGFATLRRDGFVSVTDSGECTKHINPTNHYIIAEPSRGMLLTRPLIWEPHLSHFFVNAEIRRGGFLTVELVDCSSGEPKVLAGFGGLESAVGTLAPGRVVAADFSSTRALVQWGSANLSSVAGGPVRIRFRLSAAQLFSFWVSDSTCGASRGDIGAGGPGTEGGRDMHGSCAP